ncbi:peptide chain release factor 1-like, mitochondrial isoform X1 [Pelobates cultripes]|uniref:Peptide chain release factor 1-like, mitochondrial n=1 Tax=Pelobates cultripes TaxID=61616 RepID=A0AAD1RFW4_PELCU|nr:peptide chain release factor 1-like, mitochondrial isoform X1 [Pelobates cultripes]
MLVTAARCVLCCSRRFSANFWGKREHALGRVSVLGRRASSNHTASVSDTRRMPTVETVTDSEHWANYLRILETWWGEAGPTSKVPTSTEAKDSNGEGQRHHTGERPDKRHSRGLHRVIPLVQELRVKENELEELQQLLGEENEDLKALANTEIESCQDVINQLKHQIAYILIERGEDDDNDLIMEVTAGVGGQEAMLFTAEMFDMYQRYASYKSWSFDILEYCPSEIGGLRHAAASIGGLYAYKHLKFEGGVHRVQRVPKTEKQGRIHTSTMTIAILPQPSEINLVIHPKDLRIETKRASGAGGQHVNTTDSAVRIVHIPTGVVSECQQERSQLKNKEKAMQVLRAKLYSMKLEEETTKRYNARKVQIGTRGRSEKIRTYNFPQDRVTDHRIGKSLHDIEGFLFGEELLDEMIQSLSEFSDYESLLEIISEPSTEHM